MSHLQVSEKTLELNVCAELLSFIRGMPGCNKAFWIGMKQDQEVRNGIDELIANIPAGMHIALQFKAPRPNPSDTTPYKFTINDRQNQNLLRLSLNRPGSVFYILPQYNTFARMRLHSPRLLQDTHLLKVEDLRTLPQSQNQQGTHKIETNPPNATVFSDPFPVKLTSVGETLEPLLNYALDQKERRLINHDSLKAWFRVLVDEEKGNRMRIGQRLRGFSTFCIS